MDINSGPRILVNLKYTMRNAGLEEAQAGIKFARRKYKISITSEMQMTPSLWQNVKKS